MTPELTAPIVDAWAYVLVEKLGHGASGNVWAARGPNSRPLAIKIGHSAGERQRFANEATRLMLAGSAGLPAPYAVGLVPNGVRARLELPPGVPYLALEWLRGSVLDPRDIPARERVNLALLLARDLGRTLGELHAAGFAHGDVKPQNVAFDASTSRARLFDLGLSGAVTERRVVGATPRYLAPECRASNADSDAGARDLWALGVTLAELADAGVALSDQPAEHARRVTFDPRLERLIRPLLRAAAGARPAADWVYRQAAIALGSEESPDERRARGAASLRRAYLGVRRPWLERVACGDVLELRVTGMAERWLREAAASMLEVAAVRGVHAGQTGRRLVLEDLSPLDQERLSFKLIGPSDRRLAGFVSPSDAELLARLERSIEEQSPRSVVGLVLTRAAPDAPSPYDPVSLAVALSEGAPTALLLDTAERYVAEHPAAHSLGLLVARALRLQEHLGRALALLDLLGGSEAAVEAAEIARRARDEGEAQRRLDALDLGASPPHVQARAAATRARLALQSGDLAAAEAALEAAPESVATLEARCLLALAASDLNAAETCLLRAQHLTERAEELARLEFLAGRIAHARHQYEASLTAFARAADYALRAGAVLEEATYLSGVAAAATELGQLSQALDAASRALVLYEYLGRPEQAARAALSRAGAFLVAGAREEALEAANEALRLTGDVRCQAFAHLCLAQAELDEPLTASEHLLRATQLTALAGTADDLRFAALRLTLKEELDVSSYDARASDSSTSAEARLIWWGARARHALINPLAPRSAEIIRQLATLVSAHAGVGERGPAFAAGARLAALLGDGELSRRFSRLASEAAATLRRSAPRALVQSLGLQAWTLGIDAATALSVAPEQVRDVETLVRALTTRNSLRSLLNQVLDALVLWTGVERGLLLLTAPGGKLVPRAARNLARSDLGPAQLELSYSLAERAIATREAVVAVDAVAELPEHHHSVHALKLRSLLAIPLFFKGTTLGVVYLDDRVRTGAFGPQELSWVRLVASIASVAIGDARDQLLLRRVARRAERAEKRLAVALSESEARRDVAEQQLARESPRGTRFSYDRIVGQSPAIQQLLALLDRVTMLDVPVLVLGESGSGKELVARALHDNGPRAARAFVTENCSAIPETLLESILFGHVRGAFTGAARSHAGLFSVAHQGTLFLDEIGEMSLAMQAKLLRVLETGEVRPLGSEKSQLVDVRVVGATQRDLEAMVANGTFREDLFYRLNVISLRVPPLRERRTDILLLMRHFLAKHATGPVPGLSEAALSCIEAYAWPGNVRELENEARRALVMASSGSAGTAGGTLITPQHLSPRVVGTAPTSAVGTELNVRSRVDQLETQLVRTALEKTEGNQTRAAELLGLSRFGLQKMMKRLQIAKP